MALPTQKHTKSRSRKRRATLKLRRMKYTHCPKCKKPVLPHHVCTFCGNYAGEKVLKIKSKTDKKRGWKEEKKLSE